jgi:hypothetical protein
VNALSPHAMTCCQRYLRRNTLACLTTKSCLGLATTVLGGGLDTAAPVLLRGVEFLAADPELHSCVRASRRAEASLFNEILRLVSPVRRIPRTALDHRQGGLARPSPRRQDELAGLRGKPRSACLPVSRRDTATTQGAAVNVVRRWHPRLSGSDLDAIAVFDRNAGAQAATRMTDSTERQTDQPARSPAGRKLEWFICGTP